MSKPESTEALPPTDCSLPKAFDGEFRGVGMGKIFIKTKMGDTNILDIRGWGYLTGKGCCALGMEEDPACDVQDQFERWVIKALNHYRENNHNHEQQ